MKISELNRMHTIEVLKANKYNREKTCKELGISIRTLRNWLIKYKQEGYAVNDNTLTYMICHDNEKILSYYGVEFLESDLPKLPTNEERLRYLNYNPGGNRSKDKEENE